MSFALLDSLSLAGGKQNEDAFAYSENAALVLDGATPLGEGLMPGTSDAAWLATFGARRLMAHLKDSETPRQALALALTDAEKSFAALRRRPVREKWETPSASMMMAIENQANLEFLWFGDCTALLLQNGQCDIIGEAFDRRGQEAASVRRIVCEKILPPRPISTGRKF